MFARIIVFIVFDADDVPDDEVDDVPDDVPDCFVKTVDTAGKLLNPSSPSVDCADWLDCAD